MTSPRVKPRRSGNSEKMKHGVEFARTGVNNSTYEGAAQISVDKPLTDKQKDFVRLWASGESINTACLRAGYADKVFGYRLAHQPNIRAAYEKEKRAYEAAADMTRKKVMDMLLESYEMAKLMAEPSTMVAAAREVGKMCGYYAPIETKVKVDVSGNVVMSKLNSMSDAELLELITKGTPPPSLESPPTPLLEDVTDGQDD